MLMLVGKGFMNKIIINKCSKISHMFAACTIYKSIYLGLIHASEHFLKAYGCTVLLL